MPWGGWTPFRKFLAGGCALFVVLSLAGVALEARYLRATALAIAQREAAFVGRHLGVLYFRPGIFLNSAGDLEIPNPLPGPVKEDLATLGIVMLKVYDLRGKIVAATDPAFIGMEKGDNPSFRAAIAGKTVGKVADREYYRTLYGQEEAEDLLEVYVPLWSPGRNAPEAVLELYRPWAPYQAVIHAGIMRTGVMAVGLTGVYCLLILLFIRRVSLPTGAESRGDGDSRRPPPFV